MIRTTGGIAGGVKVASGSEDDEGSSNLGYGEEDQIPKNRERIQRLTE
jgi:hypothetical protein